jgi:predicted secreted Zn-dependent protease
MARRLLTLLAASLLVGCAATGPTPPPAPASPSPSSGTVTNGPAPTPNPCVTAVAHLGAFSEQLGGELIELRPKVLDSAFDSAGTSQVIARVSATMVAFDGLEDRATSCLATAAIVAEVATIREGARTALDQSKTTSIYDAEVQRDAAAALVALLPDVRAVADATQTAAKSAGVNSQIAAIPDDALQPIGSLPPLATRTPPPVVASIPGYGSAFFGSNTTVVTYAVSGTTPAEIVDSILANGPPDQWVGGRAEALTLAFPHDRLTFRQVGTTCHVVATADPAIYFSFRITIPNWTPPPRVAASTVTWWRNEIGHVAVHEKHHVDLWRAAGAAMTKAAAGSTCTNLVSRLTKIATDTRRANCQFDVDEYGRAMGLTVESCLTA